MKEFIKGLVVPVLNTLNIDITLNQKYDRLTKKIIKRLVKENSICVDVGCHKGDILKEILKYSPQGKHYCFEPIPKLFADLKNKFSPVCNVYPFALSDKSGLTKFHLVKNAPAYSGILKRRYDIKNPEIEEIEVTMKTMDEVIPDSVKIDLIKIDAEGAEFPILRGAKQTLLNNKPTVIFECGLGGSNFYGTKPEEIFDFLNKTISLKIYLLESWLKGEKHLSKEQFSEIFNKNQEYYFIADNK